MPWRKIQRTNFRNIKKLAEFLELDPHTLSSTPNFPLNLPLRLAEKIEKKTLDDPILRQFVPLPEEKQNALGFVKDPVEDSNFCKSDKLLQKYQGRALLLASSACAMHCRYCFRQNFSYGEKSAFEKEIMLIREDTSIEEIILSGGDPLSLSNKILQNLFDEIDQIEHIKLIRFHTRFPIGIPERIDPKFLSILETSSKQCVFVIHANHAKEFDRDVCNALKSIQKLGIPVLLQAVLLRGVNDNTLSLKALLEMCIYNGIQPYYLHQLDRIDGAAHFEVAEEKGRALIKELRKCLPGYAIPSYVREIPGEKNKTPL